MENFGCCQIQKMVGFGLSLVEVESSLAIAVMYEMNMRDVGT